MGFCSFLIDCLQRGRDSNLWRFPLIYQDFLTLLNFCWPICWPNHWYPLIGFNFQSYFKYTKIKRPNKYKWYQILWYFSQIIIYSFKIYSWVFWKFFRSNKLIWLLAEVISYFINKFTPITLCSASEALDVFWVYAGSNYFHCFHTLSILYPRGIYALSILHLFGRKRPFRNGWLFVFYFHYKDNFICWELKILYNYG